MGMTTRIDWFSDKRLTSDERAIPLVYDAECRNRWVRFTAPRTDLTGGPITVHAKGLSDAQLAAAMFSFSSWWGRDVHPRLNGWGGDACVDWVIDRESDGTGMSDRALNGPLFMISVRAKAWTLLTPRRMWPRWVILWWREASSDPREPT